MDHPEKKCRVHPSRAAGSNSQREDGTEKRRKAKKDSSAKGNGFIMNTLKKMKDSNVLKAKKTKSKGAIMDDDDNTTQVTLATTKTATGAPTVNTAATLAVIGKTGKSQSPFLKPTTEQKAQYERFAKGLLFVGVDGLLREYNEQLKSYLAKDWERKLFDKNSVKNRYKDVVCNDLTRVVLSDDRGCDYIHANHVKINTCHVEFICTQGPLVDTRHDFWRMIIHCRVVHIIMLCEVVEQGKVKCEQYWPLKIGEKMVFGDIAVTNVKVEAIDKHVVKTNLEVVRGSEKYNVRHHHWRTWPDKLIPNSSLAALRILTSVRKSTTPIVVHCSAGIGRTGTIVAVELCIQKLLSTGQLNLLDMCKKLRDCRMYSVQVELQYLYLAQTIIEYGRAMGLITSKDIIEDYAQFKKQTDALTRSKELDELAKNQAKPKAEAVIQIDVNADKSHKKKEKFNPKEKEPPLVKQISNEKVSDVAKQPSKKNNQLIVPFATPQVARASPPNVHVIDPAPRQPLVPSQTPPPGFFIPVAPAGLNRPKLDVHVTHENSPIIPVAPVGLCRPKLDVHVIHESSPAGAPELNPALPVAQISTTAVNESATTAYFHLGTMDQTPNEMKPVAMVAPPVASNPNPAEIPPEKRISHEKIPEITKEASKPLNHFNVPFATPPAQNAAENASESPSQPEVAKKASKEYVNSQFIGM